MGMPGRYLVGPRGHVADCKLAAIFRLGIIWVMHDEPPALHELMYSADQFGNSLSGSEMQRSSSGRGRYRQRKVQNDISLLALKKLSIMDDRVFINNRYRLIVLNHC